MLMPKGLGARGAGAAYRNDSSAEAGGIATPSLNSEPARRQPPRGLEEGVPRAIAASKVADGPAVDAAAAASPALRVEPGLEEQPVRPVRGSAIAADRIERDEEVRPLRGAIEPEGEARGSRGDATAADPVESVAPARRRAIEAGPVESVPPARRRAIEAGPVESVPPARRRAIEAGPVESVPTARRRAIEAGPVEAEEEVRPVLGAVPAAAPGLQGNEELQPLRRATAASGVPEAESRPESPFRRAEGGEPGDAQSPLQRPLEPEIEPDAAPPSPAPERKKPSDLPVLHRDSAPQAPAHDTPEGARRIARESSLAEPASPPDRGFGHGSQSLGAAARFQANTAPDGGPRGAAVASADRPQVTIDRLDVLVHEPAPSQSAARPAPDHGRKLRARYLRRL
jgi:hypothetical protein